MSGDHGRILELAAASIDFELSRAERDELAEHLRTCTSCARRASALRADARAMAVLPLRPLAAGRADVVLGRVLQRQPDGPALRLALLATLLALLLAGLVAVGSEIARRSETPVLPAPSRPFVDETPSRVPSRPPVAWQLAASMSVPRGGHTASVLPDGRVVVVGGETADVVRSAEIYDPSTASWTPTVQMLEARSGHGAVVLPDGAVLAISGYGEAGGLSFTSERFGAGAWTPGPDLVNGRVQFSAVTVGRRVFVIGGMFGDGLPRSEVEMWDLDGSLEFVEVSPLETPRVGPTATVLADGSILVVGGIGPGIDLPLGSAELFEPSTGAWRTVAPMAVPRYDHTATLLSDGRVLVAGGQGPSGQVLGSVEIYDVSTDTWTTVAPLREPRSRHAAVVFDGSRVLVVAGLGGGAEALDLQSTEWFDTATGVWSPGPELQRPRRHPVLVRLQNGSVMVIGGDDAKGGDTAEVELLPSLPGS